MGGEDDTFFWRPVRLGAGGTRGEKDAPQDSPPVEHALAV